MQAAVYCNYVLGGMQLMILNKFGVKKHSQNMLHSLATVLTLNSQS